MIQTTRSEQHWKLKTAEAIKKPELADAPDEQLEQALNEYLRDHSAASSVSNNAANTDSQPK